MNLLLSVFLMSLSVCPNIGVYNYSDAAIFPPTYEMDIVEFYDIEEYDIRLLAETIEVEAGNCSDIERAAVAWCILNRVDAGYGTIEEVVTAPGQFADCYKPIQEKQYDIAKDVLIRWNMEKNGAEDVGRVLPREYLWFAGDGYHNYFRNAYDGEDYWDWSYPNPYI